MLRSRVLDASVFVRALFPSQYDSVADSLVRTSIGSLVEPLIARQEFINAGWGLERRNLLLPGELDQAIQELETFGIRWSDSPSWPVRALATARANGLPRIYDAIYLHCAEDIEGELWTSDRRFVRSFAERPSHLRFCPEDVPA